MGFITFLHHHILLCYFLELHVGYNCTVKFSNPYGWLSFAKVQVRTGKLIADCICLAIILIPSLVSSFFDIKSRYQENYLLIGFGEHNCVGPVCVQTIWLIYVYLSCSFGIWNIWI